MRTQPVQCTRNEAASCREAQVLLDCARLGRDVKTAAARLTELNRTGVDWHLLLEAAELHGLVPLVYLNLKQFCPESVPQDIMNLLKVGFIRLSRLSLEMRDELIGLHDELSARGIAAVPFKGPQLAERYYKELVLRTFNDLDVWVREQDVAASQACLRECGYKPCPSRDIQLEEKFLGSRLFRRLCFEYTYEKGDESKRHYLDLHWKILPREYLPISERELQDHVRKEFLWDREILSFDDEMTLIMVCVHGCKHVWSQINWVVDAAQIIKQGNIGWSRLFVVAQKLGVQNMLLSGLFLAQKLILVDLPDEAVRRIEAAGISASCNEIVERFLANPASPHWKELKRWLFLMRLMSGWNLLAFMVRRCTVPTLDEWLHLQLPSQLFSLYFVLRPVNLFFDHVPRILLRLVSGGYDSKMNIRTEGKVFLSQQDASALE
jgi:hypothetical protein